MEEEEAQLEDGGVSYNEEDLQAGVQEESQEEEEESQEEEEEEEVMAAQDAAAFSRLCESFQELTDSLGVEHRALREVALKDYGRLGQLQQTLGRTDAVCKEYGPCVAELAARLNALRKGLAALSETLEEKLTAEGVRSWVIESEPPETDYTRQAEYKALLAQAAQARTAYGRARSENVVALEKVACLEVDAAQAAADSNDAALAAEAAARRAEEARRAAELKARADEEARRKEEEVRKRKEEEERKQREEEERRRQELAKKATSPEEEERRQREAARIDPNNWPMSVYSIEPGDIDIPIGCIVRSLPGTFNREELEVEPLSQLDDVLPLGDNEELVSHIIDLVPSSGNPEFKLEEPLAIAIPHCAPRNPTREIIVKKRMPNGQWVEIECYDVTIEDIKEFKFVEVRLRQVAPLVALTRFKKETFTLTRKGGKLSPAVEPRFVIAARPATVRTTADITFEVQPVELTAVSDLKQRHSDLCELLISSSPIVNLLVSVKKFTKPVLFSLPVPPPPTKTKRPGTAAPPSGADGKEKGSRNQTRPTSAFFGLAHKKEEDLEDELHLLIWDAATGNWTKIPDVNFCQTKNKDVATFETTELPKRLLVLRTKKDTPDVTVEKIASALEVSLRQRAVQMLLRQLAEEPTEVTLLCTSIQKSERLLRKLADDGYTVGPPPSPEVFVSEGQKMTVRFRGNIHDPEQQEGQLREEQNGELVHEEAAEEEPREKQRADSGELSFVFNSHIKTKLEFPVAEIDRFAQKGINCYRGFVQVYTRSLVEQKVPKDDKQKSSPSQVVLVEGDVLLTEMLVSLPKPEPEPPKPLEKAPVSIKGDGLINGKLLRHLAAEIGDEWRKLARYLNVRRVRIQAILRNNVNNDQENAIHDMLLTWAKKVPHSCNKVEILCQALTYVGRLDLVEDMRDREQDYREERAQVLRDSLLKKAFIKVAQNAHVTNDWKFLARQLGLSELDLATIEGTHSGLRERCLQSLVRWRERDGIRATVEELLKYLRRCRYHHVIAQVKTIL